MQRPKPCVGLLKLHRKGGCSTQRQYRWVEGQTLLPLHRSDGCFTQRQYRWVEGQTLLPLHRNGGCSCNGLTLALDC
ncbi:hypothetical protein Y032_0344g3091 [Ancylostoma ceylanicum]|uniref:Uncharacterized protein n=1 Tax=Ancylostoma ceylanicum TaxID=53326 RepID=A0A016RXS0_9BILA|nr:hypothetical protein Y032_0344g3091 [Ancylostoma ceylanicum]